MIRTLTAAEAAPFFWHKSHGDVSGLDWAEFRACDGVCCGFHPHFWPDVWVGHLGALKSARGNTLEPFKAILRAFAAEVGAERIVGLVNESNRATLALCRRAGFEIDGRLPLAEPAALIGWRP